MKLLKALLVTLAILISTGSSQAEPPTQKLKQMILLDVQGLFGGRELWVYPDGKAIARLVRVPQSEKTKSSFEETRYEFIFSQKQNTQLLYLIKKHHFFSMKTKDRYGVPDEARPIIYIKSGSKTHSVGKWDNDQHKDFDPVYQYLLQIIQSAKSGKKTYDGDYDPSWQPKNFPSKKYLYKVSSPKLN